MVVLPVASSTINLSVSHFIPPLAFNSPAIVVFPVASSTINLSVSHFIPPLAFNSPAMVVFPVVSSTINLLVSHFIPPFAFNSPAIVVFPVTSSTINLSVSHFIPPFAVNNPVISIVLPTVALELIATVPDVRLIVSLPEFIIILLLFDVKFIPPTSFAVIFISSDVRFIAGEFIDISLSFNFISLFTLPKFLLVIRSQ